MINKNGFYLPAKSLDKFYSFEPGQVFCLCLFCEDMNKKEHKQKTVGGGECKAIHLISKF